MDEEYKTQLRDDNSSVVRKLKCNRDLLAAKTIVIYNIIAIIPKESTNEKRTAIIHDKNRK